MITGVKARCPADLGFVKACDALIGIEKSTAPVKTAEALEPRARRTHDGKLPTNKPALTRLPTR